MSLAHVQVLTSSADGATHAWRFENQKNSEPSLATASAERLTQILKSFTMQLRLDEEASIVGIENAAEVRTAFLSIINARFDARSDGASTSVQKERFQKVISSLVADDDRLLQVITKEAQLIYAPIGGEYAFSTSQNVKGSTVTPFSSSPVLTDNEIKVSPLNEATGAYTITITETPDTEGLAQLANEIISQMSKAAGDNAPSIKDLSVQLRRVAVYEMNLNSSWPLAVHWVQTSTAGKLRRQENIELTRLPSVHQP